MISFPISSARCLGLRNAEWCEALIAVGLLSSIGQKTFAFGENSHSRVDQFFLNSFVIAPFPVANLRQILAVLIDILLCSMSLSCINCLR